jgi:S-adenosylmethionine-diacylgycerolhomoserine-N-methlytransferase
MPEQITTPTQQTTMRRFYRFHAHIYDATRWAFLFGRRSIVKMLQPHIRPGIHLAEIGCGSGYNLALLAAAYPDIRLTGVDASGDMLAKSYAKIRSFGDRVQLREELYTSGTFGQNEKPDIILISYCLTMINPQWPEVIEQAWKDLPPGGIIAVTDFHATPVRLFEKWMKVNHVRMDGHLLPFLEKMFIVEKSVVKQAYGGVWSYFLFSGIKQDDR